MTLVTPKKACHSCRRDRLRCDRSYPHCNKCRLRGKECLGYGQLFRWTGAVASRGKLAGKTSSAPLIGGAESPPSSSEVSETSSSPACYSYTSSDSDQSREVAVIVKNDTLGMKGVDIGRPLVDPIFQDLMPTQRYYLNYCKITPVSSRIRLQQQR